MMSGFNSHTPLSERVIYDHLLHCVRSETPDSVIKRFHQLFISGLRYPDAEVRATLDAIAQAPEARQTFEPFLNRCCYILINRWQLQPHTQDAIVELVGLLNRTQTAPAGLGRTVSSGRLRALVHQYSQGAYYQRLRRFAELVHPEETANEQQALVTTLRRYPYLYQHCLTSQEDSREHQQTVLKAQEAAQQKFAINLSTYLRDGLRHAGRSPHPRPRVVYNPTLLSESELHTTLRQFVGKADGCHSYRNMAQNFLMASQKLQSYKVFKDNFYAYVVDSIDPQYSRHRFNQQLRSYLNGLFPDRHDYPLNDFLLTRTCSQVMNFLVIESGQHPHHWVFIDLINNLGSTATVGLLLKIVLLCQKVKPYLERRLAILFSHYETQSRSAMQWLIQSLEKVNLAWTTHFSGVDFSYITVL